MRKFKLGKNMAIYSACLVLLGTQMSVKASNDYHYYLTNNTGNPIEVVRTLGACIAHSPGDHMPIPKGAQGIGYGFDATCSSSSMYAEINQGSTKLGWLNFVKQSGRTIMTFEAIEAFAKFDNLSGCGDDEKNCSLAISRIPSTR